MKKYLEVSQVTYSGILKFMSKVISHNKKLFIVPMSPPLVTLALKDREFCKIICAADIRTPDGIGMVMGARLFGQKIMGRITGVDLTQEIAKMAANSKWKLFFLGASPGVAERAKKELIKKFGSIDIMTYSPSFGEFSKVENKKIVRMINNFKANVLLVAFGAPKQEKWINLHMKELCAQVFLPVGGTFDFIAGDVKRAPKILQNLGLEWLYRIFVQPKRLLRLPDALLFFPYLLRELVLSKFLNQKDCNCC